jgi:hypothetical protein
MPDFAELLEKSIDAPRRAPGGFTAGYPPEAGRFGRKRLLISC